MIREAIVNLLRLKPHVYIGTYMYNMIVYTYTILTLYLGDHKAKKG